jgi:peroxiredoxin
MKNRFVLTVLFVLQLSTLGSLMAEDKIKIAKTAVEVCPIKIGATVPNALIRSIEGKETDLKEIIKDQKAIVIFYRGGWCPYCNLHLSELQNIEDDLLKLGYKIVAISMDKPEKLSETINKHNMKYELYSDSKANACQAFGIAFTVDDHYIQKLKSFNMDLETSSGETHHILPVPAVFLIDKAGSIKFEFVNPDYKARISGKLLLEAAKLFQ